MEVKKKKPKGKPQNPAYTNILYSCLEKQFTEIIELEISWHCGTATVGGRCNLSTQ